MNANSTRSVVVESGGTQVVGHVGLHAMGSFADRLGFGESLSEAVGWSGCGVPVHDRGRVLTQSMLMLAGGGESCTDIEALGSQDRLLGDVCSDTTLYRTFTKTLDPDAVERAREAIAGVRSEVRRRTSQTDDDTAVILDIDASLVEIHSENKEGTAPHFKGGFGFHPLFCFADATGDALAGHLRAGNAAANGSPNHPTKGVLERALDEELTDHLGYDKHDPVGRGLGNSRNGTSPKVLLTEAGGVDLDEPVSRNW